MDTSGHMSPAASAGISPEIWSLIRSYLTPTTLFLLLNLVIGTIVATSRFHRRHHQESSNDQHPTTPALARGPSNVLDRLRSFNLYRFRSGDFPPEYNQSQLSESSAATSDAGAGAQEEDHHFGRSRSESEATKAIEKKEKKSKEKDVAAKMKKSSSESKMPEAAVEIRRAVAARPARVEEEHEVDARADDFINNFRHQLQLQRLNSLLNYKKMLNRGK